MHFIGLIKSDDAAVISRRYLVYSVYTVYLKYPSDYSSVRNFGFLSLGYISFSMARMHLPEVVRSHVFSS